MSSVYLCLTVTKFALDTFYFILVSSSFFIIMVLTISSLVCYYNLTLTIFLCLQLNYIFPYLKNINL